MLHDHIFSYYKIFYVFSQASGVSKTYFCPVSGV